MLTYQLLNDASRLRNIFDSFFSDSDFDARRREYPYISLTENGNEIKIRALVPGIKENSIDLQLINDSLIIEGEKKEDYVENAYIRRERAFGKFKRSVKLPYRVDVSNINAELKNGILSLTLTKSEDAKPKKIEIK
jgi:HSP20 family protein